MRPMPKRQGRPSSDSAIQSQFAIAFAFDSGLGANTGAYRRDAMAATAARDRQMAAEREGPTLQNLRRVGAFSCRGSAVLGGGCCLAIPVNHKHGVGS